MKTKARLAAAIAASSFIALAYSAPAQAITFVDVGDTFTVPFDGRIDGVILAGLTGEVTYTLADNTGTEWRWDFTVENTSSAPVTASRISTFGFNVDPDAIAAAITGGTVFDGVSSGNVPGLPFDVEFCATAGPNCSGGSGDGVTLGNSASGQFSLTFNVDPADVTFSDLYVRYQSIEAPGITDGSGVGLPIPEPATWGLMILGIGGIGGVMRRRQRQSLRYNFA